MTDFEIKLETLQATDDHGLRHTLALELAETGDPRVLSVLIGLIRRPDLSSRRGTLVYCLNNYDCRPFVELLIQLVVEGNFEVALTADGLLDDMADVSGEGVERGYKALIDASGQTDMPDWRRAAINALLERF